MSRSQDTRSPPNLPVQ